MPHPLLAELQTQLPPAALVTDRDRLAPRLLDERKRFTGKAIGLALPASAEEAALIISACRRHRVAIVPQAGNTGLVGGATPMRDDTLLLGCDRLNRVRQIDTDNYTMIAEAGCILDDVHEAAHAAQRLFPLWLGSSGSARIGGLIGTNAGGLQVLRYGNMRELVLGIEAVLPDGRTYRDLHGLRKRNIGYDLKQLLIGGEGTLGFVTAASLRLFPAERGRATALVALSSARAAIALFCRTRDQLGDVLVAFELINHTAMQLMAQHHAEITQPFAPIPPYSVLIALSGGEADSVLNDRLAELLSTAGCDDAVLAQDQAQAEMLWSLRELIPSAQRRYGPSVKQDLALPISAMANFIDESAASLAEHLPNARLVIFGHVGDGNLHYNLSLAAGSDMASAEAISNDILFSLALRHGGDISAEHGIGRLRVQSADALHDPVSRAWMRQIKAVMDPDNLFNPGVLV